MKQKSVLRFKEAASLVSNGSTVASACNRAGISTATYYLHKRKFKTWGATTDDTVHSTPDEATLLEQIISSNLSLKSKVQVLTTLLNA